MRTVRTLCRALLYVPGNDPRKVSRALSTPVDCVIFDLEDSVPDHCKTEARARVAAAVAEYRGPARVGVRINGMASAYGVADLVALAGVGQLQTVLVPKVQSSQDVAVVQQVLRQVHPTPKQVSVIASIESALAVMRVMDIAASPGVDALLFAAEDYCADVGITRTDARKELWFARSCVANAAAAYGLGAMDMVCIKYTDDAVLEEECVEGRAMGFTGKVCCCLLLYWVVFDMCCV